MDLVEDFMKGLAGSSGKTIAEGYANIQKGIESIRTSFSHKEDTLPDEKDEKDEESRPINEEVMNYFCQNIRNIEIEKLDETATYRDILLWAKENRSGDRLYLVKNTDSKNGVVLIFAFFGLQDTLLLGPQYEQRCYITKTLPKPIEDLFQGKSIFVQPFNN